MTIERQRIDTGKVVQLAAFVALAPFTLSFYLPAFPQIATEFGADPGRVQLTMTAALLGIAVGQLLLGSVSDAVGRRAPLLVSFGAFVAVSLGIAVAGTVELIIALRFLQGFFAAAGLVIPLAVVRDSYEGVTVGRTISRVMIVLGIAPVLAPVLGSALLAIGSWRLTFVGLAVFGGLLFAIAAVGVEETLPKARRRPGGTRGALRSYARLLGEGTFVGLVLVAGLSMAGQFTYVTASAFVFQEIYRLSPQEYALVFGAGAVMLGLGTQLTGFLLGRLKGPRIAVAALVVAVLGSAAIIAVALTIGTGPGRVLPVVLPLLPTVAAAGMTLPVLPAMALVGHGADAGSVAALVGAAQFSMAAIGAPLTGVFGGSVVAMGAVMAATFALGAVIMIAVARRSPAL